MRKTNPDDEMLTVAEASKEKGISQNGIRIAIRAEKLPATKKSDRLYLIRRGDLKAWKPRAKKPKADPPEG
jgi:excisionase family DNA binding protein